MRLKKYIILAGCILMMGASVTACGSEDETVHIITRADHDNEKEDDGDDEEDVLEEPETEAEREEEGGAGFWDDDRAGQSVNDFLFTISNGKEKLNLTTASFEELIDFCAAFDFKLCPAAAENYGKMIPAYSAPPLSGDYMIDGNGREWVADYIFYNPQDIDIQDFDCKIGYFKPSLEDFGRKFSMMNGKVNKDITVEELRELLDKKEIPYEVYLGTLITCKGESLYFYDDHEDRIEVTFSFNEEGKNPSVYFDLDWSYWIRRGEKMGAYE